MSIRGQTRGQTSQDEQQDEQTWRHYDDPQGLFRVEIPASWSVQRTEGTFTFRQQGQVWEGEWTITTLQAPGGGDEERRLQVSFRIERYAMAPPVLKGAPNPTDVGWFRRYRISQGGEWLTSVVGPVRVYIQYELQALSHMYHSAGWEPPAPLSPEERQERLLVVQRIIDSFELLKTD